MRRIVSVFAVTSAMLLTAGAASAQDDGLAGLHAKVRVGNKICMADHFHSGSAAGHDTRKKAEAAAAADWAGFTSWEYGAHWGSFALAETKRMSCQQAGGWSCTVEARPCRRGVSQPKRK